MAESTLSITYDDLCKQVGRYLGYGRDSDNWSADQTLDVEDCVQSGYRRFLTPPPISNAPVAHEWSFLAPVATLTLAADDGEYDLPASFNGLVDEFYFDSDGLYTSLWLVPVAEIMGYRSTTGTDVTGVPDRIAIRPKAHDGTTGQRFEALVYPIPDDAYTLYYRHNVLTDKLSSTALYPLGGAAHGDTIAAACLAHAEAVYSDGEGRVWDGRFMERIAASIKSDRRMGPTTLSPFGDGLRRDSLRHDDHSLIATYMGITPS